MTYGNKEREMKKRITIGIISILGLIAFSACSSNTLKGDYTTEINLLFTETTNTLTFKGNSVTEKQDGEVTNEGTYKISDNQLTIKLGEYNLSAELSDDKKSFIIKSSDVLGGVGKGLEYTKEEK